MLLKIIIAKEIDETSSDFIMEAIKSTSYFHRKMICWSAQLWGITEFQHLKDTNMYLHILSTITFGFLGLEVIQEEISCSLAHTLVSCWTLQPEFYHSSFAFWTTKTDSPKMFPSYDMWLFGKPQNLHRKPAAL